MNDGKFNLKHNTGKNCRWPGCGCVDRADCWQKDEKSSASEAEKLVAMWHASASSGAPFNAEEEDCCRSCSCEKKQ